MGLFSTNRTSSVGEYVVQEAKGYSGVVGAEMATIAGYREDMSLFESIIMQDFEEAKIVHEINSGVMTESAGEMEALYESALTNFFAKIKEFFVKLWERIKAIFKGFLAKFDSYVMSDSKKYLDKYKDVVFGKNLSKMKFKYAAPKGEIPTWDESKVALELAVVSAIKEIDKEFEVEDYKTKVMKECIGVEVSDMKEFSKEFHDACFDEEEEVEGGEAIIKKDVVKVLQDNKLIKNVKDINVSLEKAIKNIITQIEKDQKVIVEKMPVDPKGKVTGKFVDTNHSYSMNKTEKNKYEDDKFERTDRESNGDTMKQSQKALGVVHQRATAIQACITVYTSASLTATKFTASQARRLFAAAVAYNPKTSANENAILMDVVQEVAEYEVSSALESI